MTPDVFCMDMQFEAIHSISNFTAYNVSHHIISEMNYLENLIRFLEMCLKMLNQQNAAILMCKCIIAIGNLAIENNDIRIILVNNSNFLKIFTSQIFYMNDKDLIYFSIWCISNLFTRSEIYSQATTSFVTNFNLSKNIFFIINRFSNNHQII